jgi:hypothetical protein
MSAFPPIATDLLLPGTDEKGPMTDIAERFKST